MRCATSDSHSETSCRTAPAALRAHASLQKNRTSDGTCTLTTASHPNMTQRGVHVYMHIPDMSEYSSALNVSSLSVGRFTKAFMAGKYAMCPLLTWRSKVSRYLHVHTQHASITFTEQTFQLWSKNRNGSMSKVMKSEGEPWFYFLDQTVRGDFPSERQTLRGTHQLVYRLVMVGSPWLSRCCVCCSSTLLKTRVMSMVT